MFDYFYDDHLVDLVLQYGDDAEVLIPCFPLKQCVFITYTDGEGEELKWCKLRNIYNVPANREDLSYKMNVVPTDHRFASRRTYTSDLASMVQHVFNTYGVYPLRVNTHQIGF